MATAELQGDFTRPRNGGFGLCDYGVEENLNTRHQPVPTILLNKNNTLSRIVNIQTYFISN